MTDDDLLREFTRVRRDDRGIALEVCTVTWPTPHTAQLEWVRVARLPANTASAKVIARRRQLLENPEFFTVCQSCGERQPVGHMTEERMCHACAEKRGTVF